MKANSRRRVLISSVAMLLVAIVALGTSTYAWFTNATQAKANGISVTANAAKGLQIRTVKDGEWGTNQTWAAPSKNTISPISVPYVVNTTTPVAMPTGVYAVSAGTDGAWSETNEENGYTYTFAEKALTVPTAYSNYDPYYLSYMVDAKVVGVDSGEFDLTAQVAYTGTGADPLKDAIRIAVTDNTGKVYGVYGDEAVTALKNKTPELADAASPVNNGEIPCGKVTPTSRTLCVYIWIEGQDSGCVDDLMTLAGSYNVTFSAPGINATT